MEEPVLCLKRAVYTRWISHDQAVTAIQSTLASLLSALKKEVAEKRGAVAHGLFYAKKT